MTLDQIMKLIDAGYTKDEISALETSPENQETVSDQGSSDDTGKDAAEKAEAPEDTPSKDPKISIDYARIAKELMKINAGLSQGDGPDHKTKEQLQEEAMLAFL